MTPDELRAARERIRPLIDGWADLREAPDEALTDIWELAKANVREHPDGQLPATEESSRAVAKRLAEGDIAKNYPEPLAIQRAVSDGIALARAYLAEHPADDEEPVTEEWLRAVGFEESCTDTLRSPRSEDKFSIAYVKPCGRRYRVDGGEPWEFTVPGITQGFKALSLGTRGAVRRLLAALGIALTEPPP